MNLPDTFPVTTDPFPHVMQDGYLDPALYRALAESFPECLPNTGPTGFTMFWGDPEYDTLMDCNSAWRALFEQFQSQSFIDFSLSQFKQWFGECSVDLTNARYVAYKESRQEKECASLSATCTPADALWVRVDIMQGRIGYTRSTHVDHARRALSMLIYMSDQVEDAMVGGELVLNSRNGDAVKVISPRENRMVMFPCTPASFHSVQPILHQKRPRNFVQVTVSSSVDLWDRLPVTGSTRSFIARAASKFRRVAR